MRRDLSDRSAAPLHLADAFQDKPEDKNYLHKFLDVTRSQLLFAKGAVFVEGVTEAMLMQQFSELIGCSLRDAGVEVVVIDSAWGFEHFGPLFDHGNEIYVRAAFVTDGDESPDEVKTDDELTSSEEYRADLRGSTAIYTGYGTFEFGLLRASVVNDGHPQMQGLLKRAMSASAPRRVVDGNQTDEFAKDFMDFESPGRAYRKMKEKKQDVYVADQEWSGTWRTNGYFRSSKSEFAFNLYEALSSMPLEQAKQQFRVPRYIEEAIRFVTNVSASSDQEGSTGGAH